MRIEVDRNRCEGHGMCEVVAPEYFALDDDGNLTVLAEEVSGCDEAHVQDAVIVCPVAALRLA
ncbi:ferredoxin [Mycobacterium sp. 663a-19]|nr:ferredoxin [Mycobacterium sp. 663a-19]